MTNHKNELMQFCTFRLADRLFGVNILDVKEINYETTCTPIAHAPPAVMGYLNLRGQINLILSLRSLLGFESKNMDDATGVIFFKSTVGDAFGVVVDKIGDIVQVSAEQIEDKKGMHQNQDQTATKPKKDELGDTGAADRRVVATDLTKGICKLDKELLVVLDAYQILPSINKTHFAKEII